MTIQQFHSDSEYFSTHYTELVEQYPEQWVAIYHKNVVGSSDDHYALLDTLQEKAVPLEDVVIEHVTRDEELWILAAE